MFKSNFMTVLGGTIINASIPFIFLGMMYSDTLAYITVGICVLALIGMIVGMVMGKRIVDLPWVKDMLLDLGFPYSFIISTAVGYYAGGITEFASECIWISVGFAVFILIGYAARLWKKNL